MEKKREIWMDWLRVTACFLVMLTHSNEPFYLGGEGSLILTRTDALWASFFIAISRACVPLFVVASSYLLFPLRCTTGEFFRRRASRVLVPFLFWSVVYALVSGEPVDSFKSLLLNFNYAAGHLWFVYMLLGLYILMPLLSPWAEKVGRKELRAYIGIWLLTTLIPYVRNWAGGEPPVIYGPTGIPNPARFPLWGEASWNAYGLFYYVSGFVGYMFLGLYLRKFVGEWSWKKTLCTALPLFLAGFATCAVGFWRRVWDGCHGSFPAGGPVSIAVGWEVPCMNDTIGVVLMTVGIILLFRKFGSGGGFYRKAILPLSKAGYGMYLGHMLVLGRVSAWMRVSLGVGGEGVLGVWTTPVEIIVTAVASFAAVGLVCVSVQRIPKVGKWIMG